ncbi:hypothetical protein TNIN_60231 [Trichonephila inaurata madagascariensis]|uniref:Uncharacterized protein n=1 Tax=Trichonephila inaurata madagascariensis TaxID=2747483 RepID=A0A8X6K1P6_9ARAC|nr:hypothetical protein TNIN_60231 [Trichonephila inaurata madagascariensis]
MVILNLESAPDPLLLQYAAVEVPETEMDSKQRLRAKINDWMLQNEKEQKRDRDLQLKLLQERKKRLSNGQLINGDATNIEKNILEEIEEIDPKQTILDQNYNGSLRTKDYPSDENGTFRITKSAQSRHNESFTQKIIGLINATSKESTPFAKTRLYSSTRESSRAKEELEEKSKDDSGISDVYKRQFSSPENQSDQSSSPYSDQDSKEIVKETPKKLESNFDRFAASRKTQRRLKLREMRIEAENIKTVKQEQKTSPDQESVSTLSPTTPITDECLLSSLCESPSPQTNTFCTESQNETIPKSQEVIDNENMKCSNVNGVTSESNKINESSTKVTETSKEGGTFNRQKNTSLRSRQSRLARRINSLSATVTSPEISETNTLIVKPEKLLDDSVKSKPETKSLANGEEASGTGVSFSQEKKEISKNVSNEELNDSKQKSGISSTPTTSKNNGNPPKSNNTKGNANETLKLNGHISHKVTVSTETKSKVLLPKSNTSNQNSRTIPSSSKSRVPSQKTTTNIPSVIKTTQNVKVQQTIHRPLQINNRTVAQKAEVNGKRISPNQSKTSNAKLTSSMPKEVQSSIKEPRINNLTNGETESLKNGKGSPTSSVSSLCSLNTNVKLIKNDKAINSRSSDRISTKKITINHNGSVKFMKGNVSSNNKVTQKPPSTLNSTSKNEKNNTFRRKAFV